MKTSINLVLNTQVAKKPSPYVKYVYGMFIGVFALAVFVMSANIALKYQYAELEAQEKELLAGINNQADKKLKMLIISERSRNIASLLNARGNLDTRITTLLGVFPDSASITRLIVSSKEIQVDVSSPNLQVLDAVMEKNLSSFLQKNELGITLVDVTSFRAERGAYTVGFRFQFEEGEGNG